MVINNVYEVIRQIGKGGTGVVYLAWHKNLRKYVVLKEIQAGTGNLGTLRRETDILKNLHHPYLPQIYDFFFDHGIVYTVMDYIEGKDLEKVPCGIQAIPEDVMIRWLREMADVLRYIHSQGVIHSDIKPGNVILTNKNTLCLIDFNISLYGREYGNVRGFSKNYASPEQVMIAEAIIRRQVPQTKLTPASDIFSTGALFYHLMTGRLPRSTTQNPPLSSLHTGYSEALCNVIDKCMKWNPSQRYSDGTKLLKAVSTLQRHTAEYRRILTTQAIAWLTSALLIGTGTYCLINGHQNLMNQQFSEAYTEFEDAYDTGSEEASDKGYDLLNQYGDILDHDPDKKAEIFTALGDLSWNEGNYSDASQCYGNALDTQESDERRMNYSLALAMAGNTTEAESVINDMSGSEKDLLSAAIELQSGKYEEAAEQSLSVVKDSDNADTRKRAYETAAKAYESNGDFESAVHVLEEGVKDNKDLRQRLADDYYILSSQGSTKSLQTFYGQKALNTYQDLYKDNQLNTNGKLNYVKVLDRLGQYQKSLDVLRDMDDEDYRVNMYRAFAYDALKDDSKCLSSAVKAWDQYESSGKNNLNESDDAIEQLKELAHE